MFLPPAWLLVMLSFAAPIPLRAEEACSSAPTADQVRRIEVWTDRSDPYSRGDAARVHLRVVEPSHVAVIRVDTEGRVQVLFPYEPWGDAYLRHVGDRVLAGPRGQAAFDVDDAPGVGYVFALASSDPLDFRPISRGDAWDYRLVAGGRLRGDPYVALTDLAARLAPTGRYDYDIVPYYVDHRYSHPRFVCYQCHDAAANEGWDAYQYECRRYRVIVRDEPRFYPYRYGGRSVVAERPAHPGPRFLLHEAAGARETEDGRTGGQADGRSGDQVDRLSGVPTGDRTQNHPAVRPTGEPELRRRRP
jgi:hypothetical protein